MKETRQATDLETPSAESLFLAGSFKKVSDLFLEDNTAPIRAADLPWIVGALVFQGRVDESQLLFQSHKSELSLTETIYVSFFLGVGEARSSRYLSARKYFTENLLRLRAILLKQTQFQNEVKSHEILLHAATFFAWQGVSFFCEMSGRYKRGLYSSRKAFDASFLWDSPFARLLSADTRGHLLVRVGRVSEGLKILAWAEEFAHKNGFLGFESAIKVSRLNYEAQHGRDPQGSLSKLISYKNTIAVEDSYTRASLNVELARQFLLRGSGTLAKKCLDEAEPILEAHGHRRQKSTLWHRRAYLHFLNGSFEDAMSNLAKAEAVLNLAFDGRLLLEIIGLRHKCELELSHDAATRIDFSPQLIKLTAVTGSEIAQKILDRMLKKQVISEDDPLGALIDRAECASVQVSSKIDMHRLVGDVLDTGYLFLLPRLLGFRTGARAIVINAFPGTIVVINRIDVFAAASGSSSQQVRAFLLALSRSPQTKLQLVELLWGYRYEAARHDPLVYALVRRVRKLLGEAQNWVHATEGGYGLEKGVEIQVQENSARSRINAKDIAEKDLPSKSNTKNKLESDHSHQQNFSHTSDTNINFRQNLFLEWIGTKKFVSVSEFMREFSVSKATANRDLVALVEAQAIGKSGKARATRYFLASNL